MTDIILILYRVIASTNFTIFFLRKIQVHGGNICVTLTFYKHSTGLLPF